MNGTVAAPKRSRYYDALLINLDREVQPELASKRALFLYGATRRILASLAAANDLVSPVPENFAVLHPDGTVASGVNLDSKATLDAVQREGSLLDVIEESIRQRLSPKESAAAAGGAPAAITSDDVEAYLREHLDPAVRVESFKLLAGGRSKQTILMTLVDGAGNREERVVRRDLIVGVTGATVVDEYQVLKALTDRGYPAPRPLLLESDPGPLNSPFMLMAKIEGAVAGDVFDAPPLREQAWAAARELARLHAFPVTEIAPTLREGNRVAPTAQRLREEIADLQRGWQTKSRGHSATMEAAFEWLCRNVDALNPRQAIVHGDYSYHNLMFAGAQLSGVMDWELVRVGHPAEDIGYIRAAHPDPIEWQEFMDAYYGAGGPRLSDREMTFYTLMAKLRLMALLFNARGYFEAGLTDDLQIADVCLYHMSRLVYQISVEIRSALGLETPVGAAALTAVQ